MAQSRHRFVPSAVLLQLLLHSGFRLILCNQKDSKRRHGQNSTIAGSFCAPYWTRSLPLATKSPDQCYATEKRDSPLSHTTKPSFGCQSRFLHKGDDHLSPPRLCSRGKQLSVLSPQGSDGCPRRKRHLAAPVHSHEVIHTGATILLLPRDGSLPDPNLRHERSGSFYIVL